MPLYVPVYLDLFDHPKTIKLGKLLGLKPTYTVAHLTRLWAWSITYAANGDLSGYDDDEIAAAADYAGDPAQFRDALTRAGFLDQGATIHNWESYGGKFLRFAESNRERQKRHRDARKEGVTVTSQLRNGDITPRVELSKVELSSETDVSHTGSEKNADNDPPKEPESRNKRIHYPDDFARFWFVYPSHNGSKKAALAQWERLDADDRERAVTALGAWSLTRQWREGYVKHAERYLRDRLFDQEVPTDDERQQLTDQRGNPTATFFADAARAQRAAGHDDRGARGARNTQDGVPALSAHS